MTHAKILEETQSLGRVTATASEDSAPQVRAKHPHKDPRKVGAGRAGAATRIVKQEKLKFEPREATFSIAASMQESRSMQQVASVEMTGKATKAYDAGEWTFCVIGGIGLNAIVGLLLVQQRDHVSTRFSQQIAKHCAPAAVHTKQLEAKYDPHHMQCKNAMSTPITDDKMPTNAAYHSAVVSSLDMGYVRITKMILKGNTPKRNLLATMLEW